MDLGGVLVGIEPKDPGRCPGLNKDQSMKLLEECAGQGWKLRKHNRAMKGDNEPRVRESRRQSLEKRAAGQDPPSRRQRRPEWWSVAESCVRQPGAPLKPPGRCRPTHTLLS